MKNKKSRGLFKDQSAEEKLETFSSMLDKAVLSYPNLIKRSFVSGIFTGLGATIGVALIFIILTFAFKVLGQIPFIGTYAELVNNQLQDIKPGKK